MKNKLWGVASLLCSTLAFASLWFAPVEKLLLVVLGLSVVAYLCAWLALGIGEN